MSSLGLLCAAALVAMLLVFKKYMVVAHPIEGTFDVVTRVLKETVPEFEGWSLPIPEWEFHRSQLSKGLKYDNIRNMIMYFVCNPAHANKVLRKDPNLAGIMPCTWAVYETMDGRVFITKMNIGLMSKMYFGVIGEVMREVARTEKALLREIRRRVKQQSAFSASAAA